jgi:hypothetical protein
MTSTRGNPRIGQSGSSLTSLGAVGGPRGTAAGALRVLVEFLTQYDPKAIQQLEGDLQGLSQLEEKLGNDQIKIADRVAKQRQKITESEALIQAKFTDRQAKAALKQSQVLRTTGRPSDTRQAQQLLSFAIKRQGLSASEEKIVRNLVGARTRLVALEKQALSISADRLAVEEQEQAVSGQLSQFQQLRANLPSKLGGLALGAVGGLVGGAIIGVGFQAAQEALDAIAEGIKDLIDPARHAREAIHDIGPEIEALATEGVSRTQAAAAFLKSLGINADEATVSILAEAAAQDKLSESLDKQASINEIKQHADALEIENVKRKAAELIAEATASGDLITVKKQVGKGQIEVADAAFYEALAHSILRIELDKMKQASDEATAAQARLEAQMQATAALASIAARALAEAIGAGAGALTSPFDEKIQALRDASSESARTRAIQAKIDALQNTSGDTSRNKELANIAQERELILLRQRLRLLGANIDLDKFSGKFLLEAINAKIKALDKQAAAQDRLNRELDLQLRASQVLKRQEGESVSDFLQRRAKENRDVLSEQRALETEKVKERLQELQEKTQDEVALAELAERKKNALAKSGTDSRIKQLQKELEASKKADAAALKNKIAALEKERDALKKQADNAEYYATVAANDEIRQAIRAANSIEKIAQLSGASRGLYAAKAFLTALLQSGVLSPEDVKQVQAAIDRISGTLGALAEQQYNIGRNAIVKEGRPAFASGGFIPLNTGSTPFGSSAQFGEKGTEAGMLVLTTDMLNKMKNKGTGQEGIGQVNIYRSDDPQRDYWRTKRAVRDGISEALH